MTRALQKNPTKTKPNCLQWYWKNLFEILFVFYHPKLKKVIFLFIHSFWKFCDTVDVLHYARTWRKQNQYFPDNFTLFLDFGDVPVYSNSPQICFQNTDFSQWSLEPGIWHFCYQVVLHRAAEILTMWFLYSNAENPVFLSSFLKTHRKWQMIVILHSWLLSKSHNWTLPSSCMVHSFIERFAMRWCLDQHKLHGLDVCCIWQRRWCSHDLARKDVNTQEEKYVVIYYRHSSGFFNNLRNQERAVEALARKGDHSGESTFLSDCWMF